jgi:hypothetical protein
VGNKNELNRERKNGIRMGRSTDPMRTNRCRRADNRWRAMGHLTDGAILGGLVGPVGVECFRRRKSDKCDEGQEGGKAEESFHNCITLIIYGGPVATTFFSVPS